MRIVVLTKNWGRNFTGATLATQHFTKEWAEQGLSIDVFALNIGEYIKHEKIHIYKVNGWYKFQKDLIKYKNQQQDDVIGYSDDHFGFIFKDAGIPYYHTYHGNWPDARYASFELWLKSYYFIYLYKKTIKNANAVINVSEYMNKFTENFNKNSYIVHNGIEKKRIISSVKFLNTFLMVGNVDKRKYGLLYDLANKLREINSKIKIHVYGKVMDKSIVNRLQDFTNISFLGAKKEIPYNSYCGLINTSKIENLSISVCEAILYGIPVFCFAVGGLPEVVINNETGFLFKQFDVKEMAKKLNEYIIGEKMVVKKELLADFDWEYAASRYLDIFSKEDSELDK